MNELYDNQEKIHNKKEEGRTQELLREHKAQVQEVGLFSKTQQEFDDWFEEESRRFKEKFPDRVPAYERIESEGDLATDKSAPLDPEVERLESERHFKEILENLSEAEKKELMARVEKEVEAYNAHKESQESQKDQYDRNSENGGVDIQHLDRNDELDELLGLPTDKSADMHLTRHIGQDLSQVLVNQDSAANGRIDEMFNQSAVSNESGLSGGAIEKSHGTRDKDLDFER